MNKNDSIIIKKINIYLNNNLIKIYKFIIKYILINK